MKKAAPLLQTTSAADTRDIFSMQLQRLAGLSSRITALTIPRKFEITVQEWRALAILEHLNEATLVRLARHAGTLKSQMSRTVSQLSARGFIERRPNPDDKRSVLLYLSDTGKEMVAHILDASQERNERMVASLSEEEVAQLRELMRRVYDNSLSYYRELKRNAPYLDEDEQEE